MLGVAPSALVRSDVCFGAAFERLRFGCRQLCRTVKRTPMLDRVNRRRCRRALEQVPALLRVCPGVGETDRVEGAQTHLTISAVESISEDPAAPSAVRCDLQPEPATVAMQAGPQAFQIHWSQLVRFALRLRVAHRQGRIERLGRAAAGVAQRPGKRFAAVAKKKPRRSGAKLTLMQLAKLARVQLTAMGKPAPVLLRSTHPAEVPPTLVAVRHQRL